MVENVNTVLDIIMNNMCVDFSEPSSFELTEKDKLISKITTNINIIKNIYTNNIICNENKIKKIFSSLKTLQLIENKNNYLTYYRKIRKELGRIINDMYRYSGYHVLMSNIPVKAIPIANNKIDDIDNLETVNSEVMFDTIEHFIGSSSVKTIFQVSPNIYLVKMKGVNDIIKLCNLLDKMQISQNIIKVELIEGDDDENIVEPVVVVKPVVVSEVINIIVNSVVEPIVVNPIVVVEPIEVETIEVETVEVKSTDSIIPIEVSKDELLENEVFLDDSNYLTNSVVCIDNKNEDKNEDKNKVKANKSLIAGLVHGIYNTITSGFGLFDYFGRS